MMERETGEGTPVTIVRIPFVGVPGLECQLPVNEHGLATDDDGEPLPLEGRSPCGAPGEWTVGATTLCDRDFRAFCALAGIDYTGIVEEWKRLVR